MSILTLFAVIFVFYVLYRIAVQNSTSVVSNAHQLLGESHLSTQEFYQTVESLIHQKGLQKLHLSRITYSKGGFLSPRREYLRVQYRGYYFDICAAPFANDFFVSWWLSEEGSPFTDALRRIPIIKAFVVKRPKSFFELDTEAIFKELIRSCVNTAIAQCTEIKGYRQPDLVALPIVENTAIAQG